MYVSDRSIASFAASTAAAIFLFASTLLAADDALSEPLQAPEQRSIAGVTPFPPATPWTPSDQPAIRANIEAGDDVAALEAIEIALTQASDGATYVWRRGNGRLVGAVKPTKTFRDADSRMCRHIEMQLRLGTYTRRTEGIACRGDDGVWNLEG